MTGILKGPWTLKIGTKGSLSGAFVHLVIHGPGMINDSSIKKKETTPPPPGVKKT